MGEKFVVKLLKGIEDHRKNSSRFRIDVARDHADRISALILAFPGIETVTPAGSLRRGRETVGDLDLLATGPACEPDVVSAAVEHVATLPLIDKLMARGQNKVTFTLRNNLQVDVRLLPRKSYGAALQYFTGSKHHNVALRQRAIKRGLTLSEYALLRLEDNVIVASETEEAIYNALDLDYIPPELRENCGELEAAANHTLPQLITFADLHGDVHMHTLETDGTRTIRQMAEAALARGRRYIAITDHSKNLAMTNGMDDARALAHADRVRQINEEFARDFHAGTGPQWAAYQASLLSARSSSLLSFRSEAEESAFEPPPPSSPFHIFTGVEVDILAEGQLDLADETLAQLDIVVASVHSRFDQPIDVMTARILRALQNPYVRILGHPTGRKLLKRDPYAIDLEQIFQRAAELGVAVEHNAAPARTDLSDSHMRLAKSLGCKISINTDAHAEDELDYMHDGILQLRRAWLTPADVINTAPTAEVFLAQLRPRP
jgi:DNA polymerase (family 10)